ncbi:hypothetical protein Aduo_007092 [Ancylostoma duodenale]
MRCSGHITAVCIFGGVLVATALSSTPTVELSAELPDTGKELKCHAPTKTLSPDGSTHESSCNCSSVEKFMSKDKKCETTVKTFVMETKRNSSSVKESEQGVKTIVTYEIITAKHIVSNTVAAKEPNDDERSTAAHTTPSAKSTREVSTTSPFEPIKENIKCLFVMDLHSFGSHPRNYREEKMLISHVRYYLFKNKNNSKAGIASYGFVPVLPINLNAALNNMTDRGSSFRRDLEWNARTTYTPTPSGAAEAIAAINAFQDSRTRSNCLIFFSAQNNTIALPQIYPKKHWRRVVAVGFNGNDLNSVVKPPHGVAVSLSSSFTKKDVINVVDAVLEAFV